MRASWPALAAVATLLAGCSGTDRPGSPTATDTTPEAPVRTAEGGVEVRSLLVADARLLAVGLGPHAQRPLEMDARARQAWETCGIRLVAIPLTSLATVERALIAADKPAGRATRWLENGPLWAEAVREQGDVEPRVVALHDSRLQLRPGFLRLLARAWIEPVLRERGGEARMGAVARVELVPQIVESGDEDRWARSLRSPKARGMESQGQVLSRLGASLTLNPDQAVVIVYERTGVDWARIEETTDELPPPAAPSQLQRVAAPRLGEVTRAGEAAIAVPQPEGQTGAGPPVFHIPTLGEVLLTGSGHGEVPGSRLALILVPRMRDDYSLIGR